VTDKDLTTEGPERRQGARVLRVAAGDRRAPGQQDPGQPAHPGPADTDQVHPPEGNSGTRRLGAVQPGFPP